MTIPEEKALEFDLIHTLKEMGLITADFTGDILLKISQGGLRDIDRIEKGLKRSSKCGKVKLS